jgi:hypothetical protein
VSQDATQFENLEIAPQTASFGADFDLRNFTHIFPSILSLAPTKSFSHMQRA